MMDLSPNGVSGEKSIKGSQSMVKDGMSSTRRRITTGRDDQKGLLSIQGN